MSIDNQAPGATNPSVGEARMTEGGQQVGVRHADRTMDPQNAPRASASVGSVQSSRADILEMQELKRETLDPNRYYRWVRADESRLRKLERRGYEIEHTRKGGPEPLGQPDNTTDSSIRFGDLVLMSCPKDLRERRENDLYQYNQSRLATVATEQFRDSARQKGIEFSDQSSKESRE